MLLSKFGKSNYNLIIREIQSFWAGNVEVQSEKRIENPRDAFELQLRLYDKYEVLLEYEMSTFALKLWTGQEFEYLDNMTDDKMVYGFDSMKPENILHNFKVLNDVIKKWQ